MSASQNRKRKAAKKRRSLEEKDIACKIRRGIFPSFFLAKMKPGTSDLLREPRGKLKRPRLVWKLVGTLKALMNIK
jgi:hypothetical protein